MTTTNVNATDCADECGGCSSPQWHWLYRLAQAGRGEVRFGITEDGDTGLFWDAWCDGEWTLGVGDTAEDAVANAMLRHPDPDAEPAVDDVTRARWQAWRGEERSEDAAAENRLSALRRDSDLLERVKQLVTDPTLSAEAARRTILAALAEPL